MKKKASLLIIIAMTTLMMFGCGKETYVCGWCMQEVNQKPHKAKILGQQTKLCDDCYEGLKDMQTELY